MKSLHCTAFVLVILGALNWGLIAIGAWNDNNLNVVNLLLAQWPILESLVYLLIGLSALHLLTTHGKHCRACTVK